MVVGLRKMFQVLEDLDRTRCNLWTSTKLGLEHSTTPQPAQEVDPVLAGLMQQQLQLRQTLIDVMRRGNQQQQPQQPQQPPVGVPERERLTMDTK